MASRSPSSTIPQTNDIESFNGKVVKTKLKSFRFYEKTVLWRK
jgi:hypothetical protein